jgi:hypothetical protein
VPCHAMPCHANVMTLEYSYEMNILYSISLLTVYFVLNMLN